MSNKKGNYQAYIIYYKCYNCDKLIETNNNYHKLNNKHYHLSCFALMYIKNLIILIFCLDLIRLFLYYLIFLIF